MDPVPGSLLLSSPLMDDPHFERAVILITEINPDGATGFIINKVFERKFNELVEFRHSGELPLYTGGPVAPEKLFFIHRRPDLISDGTLICENCYLGGNFREAVRLFNNKTLSGHDLRLFVGYTGWDGQQLQNELDEGSWIVAGPGPLPLFDLPIESLWDRLAGNAPPLSPE